MAPNRSRHSTLALRRVLYQTGAAVSTAGSTSRCSQSHTVLLSAKPVHVQPSHSPPTIVTAKATAAEAATSRRIAAPETPPPAGPAIPVTSSATSTAHYTWRMGKGYADEIGRAPS